MQNTKHYSINTDQGFTLIELLIVMLIIGLLAGIIGPRLMGHGDDAKIEAAKMQIENLSTALKMYKLDNGSYPTTEQSLQALVTPPQSGPPAKKWKKGGYLEKGKKVPKDPWDNEYIYLYPGVHGDFDIISYGADGTPGGEDNNKDITSWEME